MKLHVVTHFARTRDTKLLRIKLVRAKRDKKTGPLLSFVNIVNGC